MRSFRFPQIILYRAIFLMEMGWGYKRATSFYFQKVDSVNKLWPRKPWSSSALSSAGSAVA